MLLNINLDCVSSTEENDLVCASRWLSEKSTVELKNTLDTCEPTEDIKNWLDYIAIKKIFRNAVFSFENIARRILEGTLHLQTKGKVCK